MLFKERASARSFFFVVETLMCGFHGENLNSMESELSVRG